MTENVLRGLVVGTARSFYGTEEGSVKHRSILDTYNRHEPLARGYRMTEADPWCATFVSAVAILCKLTSIIPTECSCSRMIELHKALGTWHEADDLDPQPGDLLIYDWQDSGKGDCTGDPDHIGIVIRVTKGVIRVIEGNMDNRVWHRDIPVDGRYIRGYCRPDYEKAAAQMAAPKRTFDDVPADAWYAEAVEYCARHKLMVGRGEGKFAPVEPVTRGELAAVVERLHKTLTE